MLYWLGVLVSALPSWSQNGGLNPSAQLQTGLPFTKLQVPPFLQGLGSQLSFEGCKETDKT